MIPAEIKNMAAMGVWEDLSHRKHSVRSPTQSAAGIAGKSRIHKGMHGVRITRMLFISMYIANESISSNPGIPLSSST